MKSNFEVNLILLACLFLFINSSQKSIFDETQLKYLKLKNRIFRGAVGDTSFKDGHISEEGFKLYDDLSKNEVGTIFTGYTTVSDYNQADNSGVFRIDKDEYIPEFAKLVNMVHKNGANIFMQLVHIGMNTMSASETIYAPSSLPIEGQNRNSKEMTKEDILRIENDFSEAALRAKKAGFDGVEIHGAHFYLISEFLSPLTNHRNDEYGGSDENRARFLVEVIEKVREKVGKDYIVGLKINSEDADPNGITEQGFITACQMAEKAGVDFIQVSGFKWIKEKVKGNSPIYENIGAKLSNLVKIPVIVTGSARNVDNLNEILNKSNIQYFGIARPLICEYDLIKKWKNGETKKTKCVSCNSCLNFNKNFGICVFNRKKCNIKYAESAPIQSLELENYKVTYVPDGQGSFFSNAFRGSTEKEWKLNKEYLDKEGKVLLSFGSFLIEYKNEKILFDLGIGSEPISFPEGKAVGGELLNNLKKLGIERKDITKVVFSHFHPGHIGWTSIEENGKRVLTFPNAKYYSSINEWEFWKDKTEGPLSIDSNKFKNLLEGKIEFVKNMDPIIPNLYVKSIPGHTPGMISLVLRTYRKRTWFIADLIHSDLQLKYTNWSLFSDNDEGKSIKKRIDLLEELSIPTTIIANGNFIEEAFGRLIKITKGSYKFERYSDK